METQKTQNGQNNLEKEEQSKRNHPPLLQTVLESYSNQHSVVLVKKKKRHTATLFTVAKIEATYVSINR